ncbi:PIG-L deacetylase family protein [Streptomyces sp. NPDC008163]|uniref:PIG-L deacetylase family protein n=1 Tax=Streptomyces sp. NPDC008163 TaxID=3364818 RepID=UPI0036EC9C8F
MRGAARAVGSRQEAAALIDAAGTDEAVWQAENLEGTLPRLRVPQGPVVVVAAHPDDEVLGCGGTVATLLTAGVPVHTVCLTAGEASHGTGNAGAMARLAERRGKELTEALRALGTLPDAVHAGLPDTRLDRHEEDARAVIAEVLAHTGAALCLAPWEGDLHSDHEAAGRAARRAGVDRGVTVWTYPVWMWHWAHPGDPRVPWHRAGVLPLTEDGLTRKRAALACFTSQLEPRGPEQDAVLPPQELAHHTRTYETVMR